MEPLTEALFCVPQKARSSPLYACFVRKVGVAGGGKTGGRHVGLPELYQEQSVDLVNAVDSHRKIPPKALSRIRQQFRRC